MASVAQLKQVIKKNKAGQYWEDYGPFKIGTATVCEIWTIGDGEDPEGPVNDPEIRFSLEGKGGEEKYFECFGDLAEHLNKQFTSAAREGADVGLKRISTYVASFAFIAVILALIALLLTGKGSTVLSFAFGGLVASGATYFFKVWQPITLPGKEESNGQNP